MAWVVSESAIFSSFQSAVDDGHVVTVAGFQVIQHFRIAFSGRFAFEVLLVAYFDRCAGVVVGYFPVFDVHAGNSVGCGSHDVMVVEA